MNQIPDELALTLRFHKHEVGFLGSFHVGFMTCSWRKHEIKQGKGFPPENPSGESCLGHKWLLLQRFGETQMVRLAYYSQH